MFVTSPLALIPAKTTRRNIAATSSKIFAITLALSESCRKVRSGVAQFGEAASAVAVASFDGAENKERLARHDLKRALADLRSAVRDIVSDADDLDGIGCDLELVELELIQELEDDAADAAPAGRETTNTAA